MLAPKYRVCPTLDLYVSEITVNLTMPRARLRQFEWVYARLMQIEVELTEAALKSTPPGAPKPVVIKQVFTETSAKTSDPAVQAQLPFQLSDELHVLLEAFYYAAHRVRDILRDHRTDLPGITGFEAVGVRDARNHLVEHPSRKNGVLVPSVACGGPTGPQLRLLRWSLDPAGTHDQGLPFNAPQFTDALHSCLNRATHTIATSSPR